MVEFLSIFVAVVLFCYFLSNKKKKDIEEKEMDGVVNTNTPKTFNDRCWNPSVRNRDSYTGRIVVTLKWVGDDNLDLAAFILNETGKIASYSDFVLMLNQAQGDRAILAKQLNISPQQMKYVTHTEAGEGLIFYGNVVLPFIDRFPTDTELYRLLTTKPEEVSKP